MYNIQVIPELLLNKSEKIFVQLFRSLCASGVSFALDIMILASLTEYAGLHYLISAACGFAAGNSLNYLLCSRWIFPRASIRTRGLTYTLFLLAAAGGLALNELAIWTLTECLSFHYLLSKVVAGCSIFSINFLVRRNLLFR